jgi:hypothetical protein
LDGARCRDAFVSSDPFLCSRVGCILLMSGAVAL